MSERHDQLSDHINLARAIRRAHEWKLHIAERRGHMPFEEVGARLLDEILRLQERLSDAEREMERRRELSPYPELDAHRLKRATHGLKHIASFWREKPSGGYAASILEDMDARDIGPLPGGEG